jgi:hypothetical protein
MWGRTAIDNSAYLEAKYRRSRLAARFDEQRLRRKAQAALSLLGR